MAYQKGQNGSQGQLRKKPVRDALVAILQRDGNDSLDDKAQTIAQKLALQLVIDALAGNEKARTEVIDRVDGKPPQALVGDPDEPLELVGRIELVALGHSANTTS
ncbi:MAG: hypothetical protein KGL39_17825 [Patescibacteria group bacterium]|nr:hypothetical protein [Patescibacteria group bacterium]